MEVRERSQGGKLRWSGTLENGRAQSFPLKRGLWLYIGRPASVNLIVSGHTVPIPGRLVRVSPKGVVSSAPVR
jgi:hypothetical protein